MPNINPDDLEDVECKKCQSQYFQQTFKFKKLSAIMSPDGQEKLVPIQALICIQCNTEMGEKPLVS